MRKYTFFKDANGKDSNSRLTAFIVIMCALLMAEQVLLFAYWAQADIFLAAGSCGTTFVSIAGPSLYFLYGQKKQEIDEEDDTERTK